MKKLAVMGMGVCIMCAFASCKSSESAYKKAYENAKQQELISETTSAEVTPVTPVTPTPVETVQVKEEVTEPVEVRDEKVTVVAGESDALLDYSVVCGSYGIKANAEKVKANLDNEGYTAFVVYNAEKATYRVVVGTYADRASAAAARNAFKAKYPNNQDFQKAWLLRRIY